MKLISAAELEKLSVGQLSALFEHVSRGLVRTKLHSAERRNALGSLENIARARRQRLLCRSY
jgi:hypothetical protein